MSFRLFQGRRTQSPNPTVALTKGGTLIFNRAATDKCVEKARFVELYFDEADRRVGLKFLEVSQTTLVYAVSRVGQGPHRSPAVACREFYKVHGLPLRPCRRPLTWDPKEKLWTFKVPATA